MVNKNKRKGDDWERQFVDIINSSGLGDAKRVPASGAMGTSLGEPLLTGDVRVEFTNFPRKFRVECKTGYGGATQLAVKKEWLDKIKEEASGSWSLPLLACKFSGARDGVKKFVVLDIDTFLYLMTHIFELKKELDILYRRKDT